MANFTLPDLGEGLQEAEIVEWHVKEGDHIDADALLVSVETAKAIVDIPAPKSGEVAKLFVAQGELVHTGEALMAFAGDTDNSQTVVGELTQENSAAQEDFFIVGAVGGDKNSGVKTQASNLSDRLDGGQTLSGVARSMAKAMGAAGAQVVPVSLFDQVSIEHWPPHADLMVKLIHAIIAGVHVEPALNAWFDGATLRLKRLKQIGLGIAVDTPDGLFVPVLRNVAKRSDADLRQGLERLRADVKHRSIPLSELRDASFTLSNFGTLGGRFATTIVVPPQVAILGVGRSFMQPTLAGGKWIEARQLPLSLTFDHRVLNGGQAARFLAAVCASLSG